MLYDALFSSVQSHIISHDLARSRNSIFRRGRSHLVVLLSIIAFFYVGTIRSGHVWGDDFAMYVHHARNIVEGRPYADTGYIYNPAVPVYGPRTYPPVFPLMLAPLYRAFGMNLIPMKLEQVILFVLTLLIVYRFWEPDLPPAYLLALVAILGFNPQFWAAKDMVLSDLPFLFFFYLAALLWRLAPHHGRHWWLWAIGSGMVVALAVGTRSAGVALVAGILLYDLIQFRKITRFTAVALAVWLASQLLQSRLSGSGAGSYLGQHVRPSSQTIALNLLEYSRALAGFWVASTQNAFSFLLLGVVLILAAAGLFFQYKRGFTILEAFLVPYLGVMLLWPFAIGIRAMFPLIPWMVFLALLGLQGFAEKIQPKYSSAAAWALLISIAVPYLFAYHKTDFGPIHQDVGSSEFTRLCDAVRTDTDPHDVLIYYRARALSLYTGRAASTYNSLGSELELSGYVRNIHAAYLVTTTAFSDDHGFLADYVRRHSSTLELAYQNPTFRLYRVHQPELLTATGSPQ